MYLENESCNQIHVLYAKCSQSQIWSIDSLHYTTWSGDEKASLAYLQLPKRLSVLIFRTHVQLLIFHQSAEREDVQNKPSAFPCSKSTGFSLLSGSICTPSCALCWKCSIVYALEMVLLSHKMCICIRLLLEVAFTCPLLHFYMYGQTLSTSLVTCTIPS